MNLRKMDFKITSLILVIFILCGLIIAGGGTLFFKFNPRFDCDREIAALDNWRTAQRGTPEKIQDSYMKKHEAIFKKCMKQKNITAIP